MTEYVSVQAAARRLGVAPVTVRRWTASGFLPCVRTPGGHRRIATDDIEELERAAGRGHLAARRARERELDTLIEVATALTSQLDLSALLREIARAMTLLVDCQFCAVSEYDRRSRTVRALAEYDATGNRLPADEEYGVRAFPATRKALDDQREVIVNIDDRYADAAEVAALRRGGDRSILILPLVFSGESIGLIEATDATRTRHFSRQELRLFRAVAGQAAVALHNARLFAEMGETVRVGGDLRRALAQLAGHIEELAASASRSRFLDGLAHAVCDACGALSCVASAGGLSAGASGHGPFPRDRAEGPDVTQTGVAAPSADGSQVIVSSGTAGADPATAGPEAASRLTLTVALAAPASDGMVELLDLVAATAVVLWRDRSIC